MQNFDFSDGFTGAVSSSVGESRVTPSSSSYKYQGLLSSRPAVSSKSLLSSQVTHGSATGARVNVGGSGSSNFVQRSVSAPVAQPNISMPVYAQALKISPSMSVQSRSVSSADVEVARRSLVSTAPASSSFSFLSSAYSSYQPSVYGNGITLSREGTLDYGTAYSQRRAGGQRRAGPGSIGGIGGTWGTWFDKNFPDDYSGGTCDEEGIWWFNKDEADALYEWMLANWTSGMGNKPTREDFYEWLKSEGKYRMPISDIVPLILIALAYMAVMFVRKRKLAK